MKPAVSIIMPMYGVEAFIGRAIESVLRQSFTSWELIIVNDGTKERSREIAASYSRKEPRIQIIDKDNGGLTSARLKGLEHASGKYICFIDSDDTLQPDYLSILHTNIQKYDADICMCSYNIVANGITTSQSLYYPNPTTVIKDANLLNDYLLPQIASVKNGSTFLPSFMWLRLFKKELLSEDLFVSERIVYQEDLAFSLRIFKRLHSVVAVNIPLYNYYVNSGSLTQRYRDNAWEMMQALTSEIVIALKGYPSSITSERINSRILCAAHFVLMNAARLDYNLFKQQFSLLLADESVRKACHSFSIFRIKRGFWAILLALRLRCPNLIYKYNRNRL